VRNDFRISSLQAFGAAYVTFVAVNTRPAKRERQRLPERLQTILLFAADRAMYSNKARRKALFAESHSLTTNDLSQYRMM